LAIRKGRFGYSKGSFQLFKRVVSAIQKGRFGYSKGSFQLFKRVVSAAVFKRVASAIQKGRFSYPKLSVKNFLKICKNSQINKSTFNIVSCNIAFSAENKMGRN
jgi:hypothetical protein